MIAGIGGGEHGTRGFLAAYDQSTGKEAWRFWTVPLPGEPGSETWKGKGIEHGGAPTWFTGVYDAAAIRSTGPPAIPSAEYYGDDRIGDNLYSDCILALDAKTGKLKWHYQTTPHDLWDWDATETPVVVDAQWEGRPRKLLLQANRNGFFYVLDRTDGKLLLAKAFVRKLTWASGIGRRRPADPQSESGAESGGHAGVPFAGRRHQLVLAFVQSGHRPVLHPDVRKVQRLPQGRTGRLAGRAASIWAARSAPRRIPSPSASSRPSTSGPERSRGNCRSPAPPNRGAARSARRPAWCSSARRAER